MKYTKDRFTETVNLTMSHFSDNGSIVSVCCCSSVTELVSFTFKLERVSLAAMNCPTTKKTNRAIERNKQE